MRKPPAGSTLAALLTLLVWSPRWASSAAEDGSGDWEGWDIEERIAAVNEGDLHFLPPEEAAGHHVHHNRIRIDRSSLRGGWVTLEQCHERLDAVPAAQILFNAERIRRLRIESAEGIGRAWVEGHSVQLEDVGRQARLCIAGESRALRDLGDGRYRLRNGPYMRRFLDGYYPMGVVLEVHYPTDGLRFDAPSPGPQTGFEVRHAPGEVRVEAAFEGRLVTCMDFLVVAGAAGGPAGETVQPRPVPPCGQDQVPVPLK